MKVFAFTADNKVLEGVVATKYTLKNGTEIAVVSVGETGRGRKLSFLPVSNAEAGDTIYTAHVARTMKGGLKLNAVSTLYDDVTANSYSDECILVLKTGMGFRGGSHVSVEGGQLEPLILTEGMIAQGAAGRMGCSRQYILHLPKDVVLSVQLSGRLYGNPSQYFLRFNGKTVEVITAEERELVEW